MNKFKLSQKNFFLFYLACFAVLTLQYVQMDFIPTGYTTRPFSVVFIFIIFIAFFLFNLNNGFRSCLSLSCFRKEIFSLWFPIFFIFFIFFIFSLFEEKTMEGLKSLLNIFVAFLFYWFGYTKLCLSSNLFLRLLLLSSIPMFVIGLLKLIS